ncbi:MAG TPA: alpha/beta fold hydrolase [Candidatus Paceibacterota bacterium]
MKKVFIIHGYNGTPNGSWLPWLMGELKRQGVYACSLAMPTPADPVCSEWVKEIARHVDQCKNDDVYLVGHSLGVAAILNYLQSDLATHVINGVVAVSGRCIKSDNPKTAGFYGDFDFEKIKKSAEAFAVIHGDNDQIVPFANGEKLSVALGVPLIAIKGGGHFTGSEGCYALPQAFEALKTILIGK